VERPREVVRAAASDEVEASDAKRAQDPVREAESVLDELSDVFLA
jgi:hypothetical protein